jgi:hypothetical protein
MLQTPPRYYIVLLAFTLQGLVEPGIQVKRPLGLYIHLRARLASPGSPALPAHGG